MFNLTNKVPISQSTNIAQPAANKKQVQKNFKSLRHRARGGFKKFSDKLPGYLRRSNDYSNMTNQKSENSI